MYILSKSIHRIYSIVVLQYLDKQYLHHQLSINRFCKLALRLKWKRNSAHSYTQICSYKKHDWTLETISDLIIIVFITYNNKVDEGLNYKSILPFCYSYCTTSKAKLSRNVIKTTRIPLIYFSNAFCSRSTSFVSYFGMWNISLTIKERFPPTGILYNLNCAYISDSLSFFSLVGKASGIL